MTGHHRHNAVRGFQWVDHSCGVNLLSGSQIFPACMKENRPLRISLLRLVARVLQSVPEKRQNSTFS